MFRATLAAVVLLVGPSEVRAWPRLLGDKGDRQCQQAFRLADAMFRSANMRLFPAEAPTGFESRFSVYWTAKDISGGDALSYDPDVFSVVAGGGDGQPRKIFWQKAPKDGKRLAVASWPFGWRGDQYSLYLLDASIGPNTLLTVQGDGGRQQTMKPVLEDSWTPPLVLSDRTTAEAWFIELGEPYEALPEWRIYKVQSGSAISPCRIAFHPVVTSYTSLLPPVVRRWAKALDEALGPGSGEGTLQQTAGHRNAVEQAWMNASFRPWALSGETYNTRAEVDAGLDRWAARLPQRAALLRVIKDNFEPTEQALAAYYRRTFGLSPAQAKRAGGYVAEQMYRTYFAFARSDAARAPVESNPWPKGTR